MDDPFTEGEIITGPNSFSCTLSSKHDQGSSEGFIIVRDVGGTIPGDGDTLTGVTSTHTAVVDEDGDNDPVAAIAPSKTSPFGTFAGGKFFGARGVWLANVLGADANNYELIDSEGVQQVPPVTFPITITVQDSAGTAVEDAQVFVRKAGDYYNYTSDAGNNAGDADFVVNETVDTELPQVGWLHVWDASTNTKQDYRYASWTGMTFTLNSEVTFACTGGGSSTSLQDTVNDFTAINIEEGDTVRNTTDGSWAVVDEIVDADNITTSALQGGSDNTWTSGDTYSFHRLAITYADNDDLVDIPLFNGQTNASGVVSSTFDGAVPAPITVRIRSNEGGTKYIPFDTSGSITTAGFSLTAVLQEDTVAT